MMIRYLTQNDKELFTALLKEFYTSSAVLHPIPAENFDKTFAEIVGGSHYAKGFILEHEGTAAGYAQISFTYSNEAGGICCWLEEVYVRPDFQGHGLGKEFFQFIESEFPEVKRFRLEVTRCNERAASLYQRLGYEELDYLQMIKER